MTRRGSRRALRHSVVLKAGTPFEIGLDARDRAATVGERRHQEQQPEGLDGGRSSVTTPVTVGGSPRRSCGGNADSR